MKKPLTLICRQKTKFIHHIFLEILQRYCKLIVLGPLDMPGYTRPKRYYQLVENLRVYLQAKKQFHPSCFTGDIAKIYKLILVLWACLVAHTQNDSINLCKTLMFISMLKTNLIIHFFLEILHFKESGNLIGWQHQELEFCQKWDWWWNINSNISFHFRLFPGKTNDKIFKKILKNLLWGHFGPFLPKFA